MDGCLFDSGDKWHLIRHRSHTTSQFSFFFETDERTKQRNFRNIGNLLDNAFTGDIGNDRSQSSTNGVKQINLLFFGSPVDMQVLIFV
jgi:hypothetical protein